MPSPPRRTRTGCWTCRGRGVKCDEHRPVCQKCTKAGAACSYGVRLTWIEDSMARGTCHGRQGTGRKGPGQENRAPSSPRRRRRSCSAATTMVTTVPTATVQTHAQQSHFFLHTSCGDVILYMQTEQQKTGYRRLTADDALDAEIRDGPSLPPPSLSTDAGRWAPLFGHIPRCEARLLDFYTAVVCSKTTILDERDHNPFRFTLLPMAMASTRVYHGLLAVAAGKLAASVADETAAAQAQALTYRQLALGGLRRFLATPRTQPQDLVDALASALVLCWFEIADHCQPTWTDHLAAMAILLDAAMGHPGIAAMPASAHDLIGFAWQYFSYHVVIGRTMFPVLDCLPAAASAAATPGFGLGFGLGRHMRNPSKDAYVDAYQGFSNTLLYLIDDICELRTVPDSHQQATAAARRIEQALVQLRQLPPSVQGDALLGVSDECPDESPDGSPDGSPDDSSDDFADSPAAVRMLVLESTAEAHRIAALLFLDETCALYWPAIVPRARRMRRHLVDQVLSLARAIAVQDEHITAAFPVWAVFMAGCLAQGDGPRQQVLGIFAQLEQTMFRSVPPARKVLETVWCQQDLTVDENPRVAASWKGPFRTWRQAADHRDGEGPPPELSRSTQFSWERAMTMLGGCKLSLT